MRWNMRMKAAERGIWKSTELRRFLADAGLEISAGKMSALWTGTPTSIRLDDLDVICSVLDCTPSGPAALRAREGRRPPRRGLSCRGRHQQSREIAPANSPITPRLGRNRSLPPA